MSLEQFSGLKKSGGSVFRLSTVSSTQLLSMLSAGTTFKNASKSTILPTYGDTMVAYTTINLTNGGKIYTGGRDSSGQIKIDANAKPSGSVGTRSNPTNSIGIIAGKYNNNYYFGMVYDRVDSGKVGTTDIQILNSSTTASNLLIGSYTNSKDYYDLNGGSSTTGGGGGDFDNTSQPIDFPELPAVSAVDSGFVSVYNPTIAELQNLSSFMWSSNFVDNLIKLWADPMEVILNLSLVPVAIPTVGTREVVIGNVSTGISLSVASTQFMYVDCGSINVNEYWGAYLDYSPYTKLSIVLPYVGTHMLNIDECMNKTIHVKYIVDILSGACVALVKCGNSVLYSFSGNCATNIPVTSANYSRAMQSILSGVTSTVGSAITGNGVGVATGLGSTAGAIMTSKPSVDRSGSLSGNVGLLAHQFPYLILERPRQCVPEQQNEYSGYPAFITEKLSDISGFTVIDRINLKNVNITEPEKAELIDILKRGVYF